MYKQNVIVCATAYHPYIGGAEIAIAQVAKRLAGRLDFFVLTARNSRALPRYEQYPEATVIRLGFGLPFDKWLLPVLIPFHIMRNFKRQDGFLLWGMDISQGSIGAAGIKSLWPHIPFVLTVQYGESPERLRRGRGGLIRAGFRMMLARADRVTAISSYLLALVRAQGFCGPARVIPNGADIAKFQTPNKTQNTKKEKTIITVSRLVPKNRIDLLIHAVALLKKSHQDPIKLRIIGDGPERGVLERLADTLGVSNDTSFLGTVPHEDIPSYLQDSDVFVRPSDSEGMGNAFVEAMAAGVPVIGTPVGGIPDVIEDGKTGLLAKTGDADDLAVKSARLLDDPEFAQRLSRAGEEKAKKFDWHAIALLYGELFLQELSAKKRIVIATGLFPPEIGGPATYTQLLVDALPARGVGLRVVPFRAVRGLPKIVRHMAYACKVAAAARGSDAVYAQDPVSTGLPALLAARVTGKKLLLKVVGDYAWEQYRQRGAEDISLEDFQNARFDVMTEMRRWIERYTAHAATRIIVPSAYLKGIIAQWGVSERDITVVYNACALPRDVLSREEARVYCGIPSGAFQIVSVGRLVPWKGFDALIGAMAALSREIPEVRLLIIGSGPDEKSLRQKIAAMGLEGFVTLAGSISHDDTLRSLRAGDLFVLNSSYEGFSHTVLEALAMEIPVMASDAGGNGEIITDGVNGRLYRRRDALSLAEEIGRLYRDQEMRRKFAREGRVALQRFGDDALLTATADIIFAV